MATGFGPPVLAQTGQDANPFALAVGTCLRIWRQVGWLLLLLDLELLILLQIAQMVLRRLLLYQGRATVLQILPAQQIELGSEFLLAPILLCPQRLPLLLQSVQSRRLLHQAQMDLCGGGLRRNAQQNDEQ